MLENLKKLLKKSTTKSLQERLRENGINTTVDPDALSEALCVMPWKNLEFRSHGVYMPCCMVEPDARSLQQNPPSRVAEVSPEKAFHGKFMGSLRTDMLNGKRPASCKSCWMMEAAGGESMRIRENGRHSDLLYGISVGDVKPTQPSSLDIKFGNKCNLKCRICSPYSSSLWVQEFKDVYGEERLLHFVGEKSEEAFKSALGWPDIAEHAWTDMRRWLSKIDNIELYGGEPLLNKNMYSLLEESVASGASKSQRLQYSSNGTVYSQKLFEEIFPRFKHVVFSLSLDGTFDQFEYQRHPAKWTAVMNNYEKMRKTCVELSICLSVSSINFYYLPEYLEFWADSGIPIHLNEVTRPNHFDIRVYPEAVKKIITQKIEKNLEYLDIEIARSVEVFVRHMNSQDCSHLWPEFLKSIRLHDKYRKQKYADAFPEFAKIIGLDKETDSHHTNTMTL